MKKLLLLFMIFMFGLYAMSQTKPILGPIPNDTIIVNTGTNYLLIPKLNDGDAGVIQHITVTATSSNPALLTINSVVFNDTSTFAIINVSEKGTLGNVTINVSATDADGTTNASFTLSIVAYSKPGIKFQIHDAIFWQEVVPVNGTPVFDTLISTTEGPWSKLVWSSIPITVNAGCTAPICTGHDFSTAFFKGYILPSVSGSYTFYEKLNDQGGVWLSTDDSYSNCKQIIYNGDKNPTVGTNVSPGGNVQEWKSASITLQAGKVYAFYATQWLVHYNLGGVLWEGPGIAKSYIPAQNLLYIYDPVFPTAPTKLKTLTIGVNDLRVGWTAATDNKKVMGYNIYLDGVKQNNLPVNDTLYHLLSLTAATDYSVTVSAVDAMGNESAFSNIVNVKTYATDGTPPTPPTTIKADVTSDMAVTISWSGATDAQTAVKGYQIFVNGVLYNTTDYIYQNSATIINLTPSTAYAITIKAVDAGDNVSVASTPFNVTTLKFDPSNPGLGMKKARLAIQMENTTWNEGLGIMGNYLDNMINKPEEKAAVTEMKPSAINWGGLGVNPMNLKDYSGTASGKPVTYAKFMDFANQLGSYALISTGISDATDWRKDSTTFDKFIEYLNGPATSTMGALRAAEGFTDPLLTNTKCKGLMISLGCEVWGGNSHNAQVGSNYDNYAKWSRMVALRIKNSPYYDPQKIFIAYSGRNPDWASSVGLDDKLIKGDTGQVDWLSISGYMGGNMNYDPAINPGESELDYYKNGYSVMVNKIAGLITHMQYMFDNRGKLMPMNFYESNMTNPSYNGRLGQAILMTDYMATAVETGVALPCVFHLTGGEWRITMPEKGYNRLSLFRTSQYFNTYCKGAALKCSLSTTDKLYGSDNKVIALDPVGSHAYTDKGNYAIALFSRDFENDYQVQIDLPNAFTFTAAAKKYVISGNSYSSYEYTIDSSDVTLSDSLIVTVPKYSMVIIRFTGQDQNFVKKPLGYFNYKKIQTIKIVSDKPNFDIEAKYGVINLTAEVTPTDAMGPFTSKVGWEVVSNTATGALLTKMGASYQIRDLGKCTGSVTMRAYSFDDKSIKDEVTILLKCSDLDENTKIEAMIYPNPASDILNIVIPDEGWSTITIFDMPGKILKATRKVSGHSQIDISDLQPGIYFIRIDGKESKTLKFIKQ